MSQFYYIVHATTSDNVGQVEADDEKAALKRLEEIYGKASKYISYDLITKAKHDSEGKRIAKEREEEANRTADST